MCGIAGLIDLAGRRPPAENDRLNRSMGEALRRRGPDAFGVWNDSGRRVWLAHARLAIQDLTSAGAQPMTGPDGASAICYNGEGYNTESLRPELIALGYGFRGHSDTEIILAGFDHWGVDAMLGRVAGMFAFAYYDARRNVLCMARDRLGKKPLYWTSDGGGLAFASELAPLLLHPDTPRRIDRDSVEDFLRWSYIPAPQTILRGVQKVEPGQIVEFDLASGAISRRHYWRVEDAVRRGLENPFDGGPADAVDETGRILEEAVRGRMISDVPLGAFLSGGVDSSLVVATMQAVDSRAVRTFSIGFDSASHDESGEAARVANHLGTKHTSFLVQPADALAVIPDLADIFDEPFADASQIPTYIVAKVARREVTVAMTGDGGDEVFSGYNRHIAANGLLSRLNTFPAPVRRGLAAGMTTVTAGTWDALLGVLPASRRPKKVGDNIRRLAALLPLSEAGQYKSLTEQWVCPESVVVHPSERPHAVGDSATLAMIPDPAGRMRYLDLISYLPGDILTKVDRATMAASLEARAPLLDHRLVEFSCRLNSEIHMHEGQGKWILRRLLERHVPRDLFERPKMGFSVPLGEWLRGPLRDWAETLLSESRLTAGGLLRPAPIRRLWGRHLRGEENAEYRLWPVLMLQAWQERYGGSVSL